MAGNGGAGVASYGDLLLTSLVVLIVVCIVGFVIVRVFGRFLAIGRTRGAHHLLDVVARVPLEPRRSLYVVEVAGKTLLVGTSEMGLNVLSELDGSEVRARNIERPSFADLVKQAWARRKDRTARAPVEAHATPSGAGSADASRETSLPSAPISSARPADGSVEAHASGDRSAASSAPGVAVDVGDVSAETPSAGKPDGARGDS